MSNPIDIFELAKPEIDAQKEYNKRRNLILEIVDKLIQLKKLGKTDKEIQDVIFSMKLPFDIHMFITGNYSALMDKTHKIFTRKLY